MTNILSTHLVRLQRPDGIHQCRMPRQAVLRLVINKRRLDYEIALMKNVTPIEIAAPNIMAQNRYALNSILRTLFFGNPKILENDLLPAIAMMTVAMIHRIMANFA
jgi:hypothetical protein